MKTWRVRSFLAAALFATAFAGPARAQWGYPGGYGGFGWGGWGFGGETVGGANARGLGALAAGEGFYNQQTAVANSINADTVMRWNQYWWEAQLTANKAERERIARRAATTKQAQEDIFKRLRDNPQPRDVYQGSALNVAMEEILDPRVYTKSLAAAKVKIGGDVIRDIPFQYAPGAITVSIHQLTQKPAPAPLQTKEFEADRTELKSLGQTIREQIRETGEPDEALIDRALELIEKIEGHVGRTYARNSRERNESERYLRALRGLVAMLKTPAIDMLLKGVGDRPDATLTELLHFMSSFNLRFGAASTPRQRQVYDSLFPKLRTLRDQIAPALAAAPASKTTGDEPAEFFSGMSSDELKKKAKAGPPAPNPPK